MIKQLVALAIAFVIIIVVGLVLFTQCRDKLEQRLEIQHATTLGVEQLASQEYLIRTPWGCITTASGDSLLSDSLRAIITRVVINNSDSPLFMITKIAMEQIRIRKKEVDLYHAYIKIGSLRGITRIVCGFIIKMDWIYNYPRPVKV